MPKRTLRSFLLLGTAVLSGGASALLGNCGPFTDVAADVLRPFVLEIFYLGITTETTATTYDPAANVTRLQMAAFLSRAVDGVLRRGSRRAAANRPAPSQPSPPTSAPVPAQPPSTAPESGRRTTYRKRPWGSVRHRLRRATRSRDEPGQRNRLALEGGGPDPVGSFAVEDSSSAPAGAASDGINFWVALSGPARLARF